MANKWVTGGRFDCKPCLQIKQKNTCWVVDVKKNLHQINCNALNVPTLLQKFEVYQHFHEVFILGIFGMVYYRLI